MKNNEPEVQAILLTFKDKYSETVLSRAVRLIENHDPSCVNDNWNYEPLVRLSDYEALRNEFENLRKASSELANWCFHEVGVDIELTPGLKQVMDITGDVYDNQ